jgi:hypothetical protein
VRAGVALMVAATGTDRPKVVNQEVKMIGPHAAREQLLARLLGIDFGPFLRLLPQIVRPLLASRLKVRQWPGFARLSEGAFDLDIMSHPLKTLTADSPPTPANSQAIRPRPF